MNTQRTRTLQPSFHATGRRHSILSRLNARVLMIALAVLMLPVLSVPGQSTGGPPGNIEAGRPKPQPLPPTPEGATEGDVAADGLEPPVVPDVPQFPISNFTVQYLKDNPLQPAIGELMQLPIILGKIAEGYIAPAAEVESVAISLADINGMNAMSKYSPLALQRVLETLRDHLVRNNLLGVFVAPDPAQITPDGRDLRNGKTALALMIATATVTEIRTLASGERVRPQGPIKPVDRINNPAHARILDNSPIVPYVAPAEGEEEPERQDLLNKSILDDYLFLLSRHPGRRLDASVTPGLEPGTVGLDYQVTENRPWTIYAQLSNTGTEDTSQWRERFGLFNTQLTNNDDIFTLDYITANFEESHALLASYEAPLTRHTNKWRWRVYGDWSQFTASDVGFFNDQFKGESWSAGGDLIVNVYQKRDLFIDLIGGARFLNTQVENETLGQKGDVDFILPHAGARLDNISEWYATQMNIDFTLWLSSADAGELTLLGRTDPSEDPVVFQGGLSQSVYLEPLFDRKGWENPTDPNDATLAHELFGSVRGQYTFDDKRLIPQAEAIIGGLFTVRGYPESIINGDNMVVGTLEYRYHVPRDFAINPEPGMLFGQPFRTAPQYVYGRPDWDLILRAFTDAGRTYNNDAFPFESDETLWGAGIGIEFILRRNLDVRLDWGFALEDVESADVSAGDNRLHFVLTVLF